MVIRLTAYNQSRARSWTRTSDPFRVKEVRYHYAMRASIGLARTMLFYHCGVNPSRDDNETKIIAITAGSTFPRHEGRALGEIRTPGNWLRGPAF